MGHKFSEAGEGHCLVWVVTGLVFAVWNCTSSQHRGNKSYLSSYWLVTVAAG